jgi:hypothetical protein
VNEFNQLRTELQELSALIERKRPGTNILRACDTASTEMVRFVEKQFLLARIMCNGASKGFLNEIFQEIHEEQLKLITFARIFTEDADKAEEEEVSELILGSIEKLVFLLGTITKNVTHAIRKTRASSSDQEIEI